MSSRSAARGSAAASSIRLTPRTSKAVATSRASPSRCFLFCRGSRAARSAPIAVATVAIPPTRKPPQARRVSPITERSSAPGNLMGGKTGRPTLLDFFSHENGLAFLSIEVALVGSRRDRQHISVELVEPDLVGSGPGLIPRDVDVVRHLFGLQGERPGVGHHGPEQFDAFLFGWNGVSRRNAVFPRENRVHAAIGRVADVTVRVFAELIIPLAGCEHLPNVRLKPPGAQNGVDVC